MIKKHMFSLRAMTVAALMFVLPLTASAWGMLGHRIVGEIASTYLQPKARKAIIAYMGHESLAMSANWADFIKSDTSFNYLNNWHYVNLPADLNREGVFNFLKADKGANVYNKITAMIRQLKDPRSTADQKRFALRILVHLVGDVHQPMHTARKEDLGGNKVNVTWFGQRSNLHRVWDEQLIDYQQLSYTEYAKAINAPSAIQLVNWRKAALEDWVWESYQVCNRIYSMTAPDAKLSYRYNFDFVESLNTQLLKGGIRLARILNEIYA
ncbi:S1/P1 nuclease [Pedobacter sp. SYP-B3415]|uniref:S1/P1 nuclease n=1 Tax=Pedobacter sp. SYP-B3415 TaxID=2496641 RepID=UPI001F11217F|nr:S1/P1 nuclease [Pedobacter sp. SYP-B3415]